MKTKNPVFEYPENIARFYDAIYHQQRDGVDNEFFLNEVLGTKGKVLEIGVGTGRLFMNSLQKGADIFGMDISASMLDVLYGKLEPGQHYRISKQNIINFSSDINYDLIIAPFRVMMHLTGKEDQIAALNNVYRHLNNHGRFIFDAFVPDLRSLIKGISNQTDFEGEYAPGKKVKRIVNTRPDLINQIINVSFHLEWEDTDSPKEWDWTFPMRYYFRFELEHLIERSMFETYKIVGDYQGNELNNDSKEFIAICQKK